ncbi:MAG: hypothetical protein IKP67_03205 [Spirochaetales bacterium]|nr:hypothetical protein [Spirochaetales bacterium]
MNNKHEETNVKNKNYLNRICIISSCMLVGLAIMLSLIGCPQNTDSGNQSSNQQNGNNEDKSVYVLMNIPYSEFYAAEGVGKSSDGKVNYTKTNVQIGGADAVTSATTKYGNYGLAGGGYHYGRTYKSDTEAQGATAAGVTWPVKASSLEEIKSLGGTEVTADTTVKTASNGKGGKFNAVTTLTGWQCLTETGTDYSYYVLDNAPTYYMTLTLNGSTPTFSAVSGNAETKDQISPDISYNGHHAGTTFKLPDEQAGYQINAVVITAGTTKAGLLHLWGFWRNQEIGLDGLEGVLGTQITNVRVYCNENTTDVKNVVYHVFDYPMNVTALPDYTGDDTAAALDNDDQTKLNVTIPSALTNPKVTVTYSVNRVSTTVIEDAEPDNGVIVLDADKTLIKGTYSVQIKSDNYAPIVKSVIVSGSISEDDIVTLNENIIRANAYAAANDTLTDLSNDIKSAWTVLSASVVSNAELTKLKSDFATHFAAANAVTLTETAFSGVVGTSGSRAYVGLFKPTIFDETYDETWKQYCVQCGYADNSADTAAFLKASISAETWGATAVEGQTTFNCELHPTGNEVLTFSVDDGVYKLNDGTNTYTYDYLGISYMGAREDWHAVMPNYVPEGFVVSYDCAVYKAKEDNAGEYKYVMLLPDTPEETYHIEFRYGSDIDALQKALSGKYSFWLAAGIPQDADDEMIDNVIKLFVTENLAKGE